MDEDLEKIGVKLGHRKKLLRAIPERGETPFDVPAEQPGSGSKHPATSDVERRQLSVMFCDLVGSVALGERMDVKDYRDHGRGAEARALLDPVIYSTHI